MLIVAHKIAIGSTTLTSGKSSRLLALETDANLAVPVNCCRIVVDGEAQVSAQPGDTVKIEVGYDSSLEVVFTGTVASVERSLQRITVEAHSSFAAMTASRFNSVYAQQAAGEIAGDLMGRLNVKKSTVDNGEKFAAYAVSDHQTVWEALNDLAQYCGFDFYADSHDKAVFTKYSASTTHSFNYGANILDYERCIADPPLDGVEVYGESPVGQGQGDDASSWLTKKPVKGAAGKSSGEVLRIANPAARTQSLAKTLATNLFRSNQVKARGTIRVIGAPKVQLGDAIQVSSMPESSDNGTFKVVGVRHRLSSKKGFVTSIEWEKN